MRREDRSLRADGGPWWPVSAGVVEGEVAAGPESQACAPLRAGGWGGRVLIPTTLGLHAAITAVEAIKGLLITGRRPCTRVGVKD